MLVEWSAGGEFSARDNFRSAEQSPDKHRETSSAWFRVENRLDYYHKIEYTYRNHIDPAWDPGLGF